MSVDAYFAWRGLMEGHDQRVRRCRLRDRLTLIGMARAHSDVADVTSLDDVVQCLHGLLDRRRRVKPVAYRVHVNRVASSSSKETYIAEHRYSRAGDASDSP